MTTSKNEPLPILPWFLKPWFLKLWFLKDLRLATRGLVGKHPMDNIVRLRNELVWREFSYHQLFHFPKLNSANWNVRYDDFLTIS